MGLMLDCPDAKALSHFYAELLGKPVTCEADGVAMIGEDGAGRAVVTVCGRRWAGVRAASGPRGCDVRLRTIRSAHHDVERRPRWTLA